MRRLVTRVPSLAILLLGLRRANSPKIDALARAVQCSCSNLLILLLVIFLGRVAASGATNPQPQAEVLPGSAELLPGGQEIHVLIVLRNPSGNGLRDIKLSWLNDEGIKISSTEPLHLATLAAHSDTVWTLAFSQAGVNPVA